MHFALEANGKIRKVCHLNYSGDGWGVDFLKGQLFESTINNSGFNVEFECKKITLPDFFEVDGVPISNGKLIKALDVAGVESYQKFPANIIFEDEEISGYYIFNITERIDCIDMETTKCTKMGPSIIRMIDLKIKADSTNGKLMFRAHRYQCVAFISASVKEAIERENISGCEIRLADGWNDVHLF